ncbi:MAG: carboxylating nicotinate-nucleotide diphosphorylase [Bacteroidetes bacterium]|nr:carboxylating nicotinate-nucleotide diphosphorylase [Bacteroidota bacterium]
MDIQSDFFESELKRIIQNALREDIGDGDHSSLACIPNKAQGSAKLLVKDSGVLAGVAFAQAVCREVDASLQMDVFMRDGEAVKPGDVAFHLHGSVQAILKAERLMLNGMQRMSAIATKTKKYSDALQGTNTKILDTRKTTPGIRLLEKWAVQIGGGTNHRFGLFDAIMLKDNHIDFAGGVAKAISLTKEYLKKNQKKLPIIVEARNITEIQEILKEGGIQRILIDNFSVPDTKKAVALIGSSCETESSGGITFQTLRSYADCGVNYISSGALTHAVNNLDLSLKAL